MRNGKAILSIDKARTGQTAWLSCCWDDCEEHGVTLHRARFHDHARGYRCDHPDAKHIWYVFCSERHRQLFLHSHVSYGKLPVGERGRIV